MSRILIVDDDYDTLRYCEGILAPKGHEVLITSEPAKALKMLETHTVDLVIVDIVMPNITGFDFLKALKKIEKFKAPILMLTGRSAPKDVLTSLELGATDYLVKPIDHELLNAKVDTILGKNSSNKEIQFAQGSAHYEAQLNVSAVVTSISEMGVRLHTASYMERNTRTNIETPLFEEIGIAAGTPLRTVSCKPIENDSQHRYEVFLSFIGLDEASMQKIRRWVYNRSVAVKRAA